MPTDSEAVRQVRASEETLTRLRERDAAWAGPPAGSPMAVDDAAWPATPCSEAVRNAMRSAHDHLDLVRLVLLDHPHAAPPQATYSALRGALVGSCLALWVVGCDHDALRRARALALVAEDYKHRHAFHQSQARSTDPARAEHSRPWVEHWQRRRRELDAVRAELPRANASPVTPIITWVAKGMFSDASDAYATLVGLWQSSSSSAHALGWGAFVRPGLSPVGHDPARGLSGFTVALDADDAGDHYSTCVALLVLADGLFRQRCSS